MIKDVVRRTHFIALAIVLLNFLLFFVWKLSFVYDFELAFKVVVIVTGAFLFFRFLFLERRFRLYYSLYVLAPLAGFLSYLFGGLFGAIVLSVLLLFFSPSGSVARHEQYELRTAYQGMLSACCSYNVYERKYLVLEKQLGSFTQDIFPKSVKEFQLDPEAREVTITYKPESQGETDVTLIVQLKDEAK